MGDIIIGLEAIQNRYPDMSGGIHIFIGYVMEVTSEVFVFVGIQIGYSIDCVVPNGLIEPAWFIGLGIPIDGTDTVSNPIPTGSSAFVKLRFNAGRLDNPEVYTAMETRFNQNACYVGLHGNSTKEVSYCFGFFVILTINP